MNNIIPLRSLSGRPLGAGSTGTREQEAEPESSNVVPLRFAVEPEAGSEGMSRLSAADINGYVDGQLDDERRRSVEHILRTDQKAAAMVRQYRQQIEELRRLYEPVAEEPVPQRMRDLLATLTSRSQN